MRRRGAALGAGPAAAQFRVEISGVGATQIPVAVARFRGEDDAAPSLGVVSAIVRADLERSGAVPLASTPTVTLDETAQPAMAEWRGRGADALVGGSVTRLADGRLDVRYKLWDVVRGQDLGGQSLAVPLADLRLAAHRIADAIYERLTGDKGVFSTRIAYVTRGRQPLRAAHRRRRRRGRPGGADQPRPDHLAGLVARTAASWPTCPSSRRRPWSGCRTWPPASAASSPTSAAATARRPGRPTVARWP